MRRNVLIGMALLSSAWLAACSGSATQPVTLAGSGVPMSLTIGDTPPTGVAVLFLEALITGAKMQPSDMSKPAVSVLSGSVEVEFSHLQTDTAFLSLTNVTPGTYQSITLTFGSAVMSIVNHSGAAIGGCANNAVCQLTPAFVSSSVTLSSSPFPVIVDKNSVLGIKLDLNVNSSVQNNLTINPMVTIAHLTQRHDVDEGKEMEDIDELEGQVTAVGKNQFTLMAPRSDQTFTISVDGNTKYEDFDRAACTANPEDFTCVRTGQILDVRLSEDGAGTMLAKRVEFVINASQQALKGTITSVDSSTQFHMVVFNEEINVNGITEGAPVVVTISPNATFQIGAEEVGDDGGFNSFGSFSFASSKDLLVGQDVQIRPGTETMSEGVVTVTTDLLRLWPSQVSGQVGSIDSATGRFTLTKLSPLFTGATPSVNTITVQMLPLMEFGDFPGQSSVAVSQNVSVKGLLFNAGGTPTLVTRIIDDHEDH